MASCANTGSSLARIVAYTGVSNVAARGPAELIAMVNAALHELDGMPSLFTAARLVGPASDKLTTPIGESVMDDTETTWL